MRAWSMCTTWRLLKVRNEQTEENHRREWEQTSSGEQKMVVMVRRNPMLQLICPIEYQHWEKKANRSTDPTDAKEQNPAHPSFVCSIEVSRMRYRSSTSPKPSTVQSRGGLQMVRVITFIRSKASTNTSWSKVIQMAKEFLRPEFRIRRLPQDPTGIFEGFRNCVDCTHQGN